MSRQENNKEKRDWAKRKQYKAEWNQARKMKKQIEKSEKETERLNNLTVAERAAEEEEARIRYQSKLNQAQKIKERVERSEKEAERLSKMTVAERVAEEEATSIRRRRRRKNYANSNEHLTHQAEKKKKWEEMVKMAEELYDYDLTNTAQTLEEKEHQKRVMKRIYYHQQRGRVAGQAKTKKGEDWEEVVKMGKDLYDYDFTSTAKTSEEKSYRNVIRQRVYYERKKRRKADQGKTKKQENREEVVRLAKELYDYDLTSTANTLEEKKHRRNISQRVYHHLKEQGKADKGKAPMTADADLTTELVGPNEYDTGDSDDETSDLGEFDRFWNSITEHLNVNDLDDMGVTSAFENMSLVSFKPFDQV